MFTLGELIGESTTLYWLRKNKDLPFENGTVLRRLSAIEGSRERLLAGVDLGPLQLV